jgi:hypothetical protein
MEIEELKIERDICTRLISQYSNYLSWVKLRVEQIDKETKEIQAKGHPEGVPKGTRSKVQAHDKEGWFGIQGKAFGSYSRNQEKKHKGR